MSKFTLTDQRLFLDGYEVTTVSNTVKIEATKDVKEATPFNAAWREKLPGLKDFSCGCGGYMDVGDAESAIFEELNDSGFIFTVTPETQTAGSLAFIMKAVASSLNILGSVGEVAPFSLGAGGNSVMAKGMIFAPLAAVIATGDGTVINFPDATSGQTLTIAVHIVAVSGTNPTLTMVVESSAVVGMTTPTTIITTASQNAVGALYQQAVLANTNKYFRVRFTVGGTNPSFTVIVSASII